jgi:hypothetical protein
MRRVLWAALAVLVCTSASAQEDALAFTRMPPEQSGLAVIDPILKWPWISSAVDVDGDGDLDFCLYGHHGLSDKERKDEGTGIWYANDGKGRFTPTKSPANWKGMGTIEGWWYDFSGDGVLDMIGYEAAFGKWFLSDGKGGFTELGQGIASGPFDGDGDGVFEEFSVGGRGSGRGPEGIYAFEPGVAKAGADAVRSRPKLLWTWADLGIDLKDDIPETRSPALNVQACCDLDGDDVNDLIVWRHVWWGGDFKFKDVAMRSWVLLGRKGAPPELANARMGLPDEGRHAFLPLDLDADGDLDIADLHGGQIFINDGKGKFTLSTRRLFPDADEWKDTVFSGDGDTWTVDFGNTGRRSILVNNSHGYATGKNAGIFTPAADGTFTRVRAPWGSSFFSVTPGDFDADGDVDVAAIFRQKEVNYFRNDGIAGNHWLKVRPAQKAACNSAMGCKLRVYRAGMLGRPEGLLVYAQPWRDGMRGRSAAVDILVGLGPVDTVDLSLRFPASGRVVERRGMKADQLIVLREE